MAELERAKKARKLCHALGAPGDANFKKTLGSNQIKDCPVVEKDADLAEAIFGPDVSRLKGKTPRKTPKAMVTDIVSIPPEMPHKHSVTQLCTDIVHVNEMGFPTAMGCPAHCRKTVHTSDGEKDTAYEALDQILCAWNSGGFHMDEAFCDNGFEPIVETVKDELKCDMNCNNPQDHS